MYYIFKQSKPGEDRPDENLRSVTIKSQDYMWARKKLPDPDVGRVWILVAQRTAASYSRREHS
jgi:hypothetical protein